MRNFSALPVSASVDDRRCVIIGYAINEHVGLAMGRGKGWYGSNGHVDKPVRVLEFTVNGEKYQFPESARIHVMESHEDAQFFEAEQKKTRLKEQMRSKFSPEDLKLLGIEL